VENALAFGRFEGLKISSHKEKLYLEDEIRTEMKFAQIIGKQCLSAQSPQTCRNGSADDSTS